MVMKKTKTNRKCKQCKTERWDNDFYKLCLFFIDKKENNVDTYSKSCVYYTMNNKGKTNKMKTTTNNLINNFSYEDLAHALYLKGERDGVHKITDKTQWREFVIHDKLGHKAFDKISAGKGSDKYGAEIIVSNGQTAEYKSKSINDKEVRNLTRQVRNHNTGLRFSALKVLSVFTMENIHKMQLMLILNIITILVCFGKRDVF